MTDAKREVDDLRHEMSKVDLQLLALVEKRARAARRIGELRGAQPAALPVQDHAAVRALVEKASGELPADSIRAIFREIYAASLGLELASRVAFLGPDGGAGNGAATARFGEGATLVASETAALAIEDVERKRADYAVVPFETSTEGPVQATLVALTARDVKIAEVLEVPLELHLLNRTGNASDIEKVYATAQDHALCEKVLALLPRVSIVDVKSPLLACQLASDDHGAAAIATESCGGRAGLTIARRSVTDVTGERIRYAVIAPRPSGKTGSDVTAFAFAVQDAPGSLLGALKQFAERGINLTKLQSRPIAGDAWAYLFFAEVSGHFTDRPIVAAFEEMKRAAKFFKVLGSYPV